MHPTDAPSADDAPVVALLRDCAVAEPPFRSGVQDTLRLARVATRRRDRVRAGAGITITAALVVLASVGPLRLLDRGPRSTVAAGGVVFGDVRDVMCYYADDTALTAPKGKLTATSIDGAKARCAGSTGLEAAGSYVCYFNAADDISNYAELGPGHDWQGVAVFPLVAGKPTTCAAHGLAPMVPNPGEDVVTTTSDSVEFGPRRDVFCFVRADADSYALPGGTMAADVAEAGSLCAGWWRNGFLTRAGEDPELRLLDPEFLGEADASDLHRPADRPQQTVPAFFACYYRPADHQRPSRSPTLAAVDGVAVLPRLPGGPQTCAQLGLPAIEDGPARP